MFDPFEAYSPARCTPDQRAWDELVAPIVAAHCGGCHGGEPSFGAPFALTEYEDLLLGAPGNRKTDRLAIRAGNKTMPPPGSDEVPHGELDTLVEWATCGLVHPNHANSLVVSRPLYPASVAAHTELPYIDVTATEYPIARATLDDYRCFAIDAPLESERFIKRLQVVLDDSRVLHHVVLMADPNRTTEGQDVFPCFDLPSSQTPVLYAWAPGTGAFDFEEGGVSIEPGDRLFVQIHYNNGAGVEGVSDSSGIRIYHEAPGGTPWQMVWLGPEGFSIAPRSRRAVCNTVPMPARIRVLAGMPHMHEIGAEFRQEILRSDGNVETIVDLTGWAFETQRFYRYDLVVNAGDSFRTRCVYDNPTNQSVRFGTGTSEEMCYQFLYVAPL